MKYKNIGTKLLPKVLRVDDTGSKNPQNLLRYGWKGKAKSNRFLTKGAFGNGPKDKNLQGQKLLSPKEMKEKYAGTR